MGSGHNKQHLGDLNLFSFGSMAHARKVVPVKEPSVFNNMPSIGFSNEEVTKLFESFALTIVGSFDYGIPKIFEITKMLKDLKIKSRFSVSIMDKRHIAVQLTLEEDFNSLWLLENPTVNGITVRFS